ncbi:MAG TPA: hypothetical protein DCF45_00065 [Gammaproteobacteria bacterium]|nr:hypothetical protein [Gammaproteobacteria bacterium]
MTTAEDSCQPACWRWSGESSVELMIAGFAILLCLLGCLFPAAAPAATQATEEEVKAAFLFNFARYSQAAHHDKRRESTKPQHYNFCFQRHDSLVRSFARVTEGARVGSRTVVITRIDRLAGLSNCDLLYLRDGELADLPAIPGLLTVGDGPGFLQRGGMIELRRESGRLRFGINRKAAQAAGLMISAQLLELAAELVDE